MKLNKNRTLTISLEKLPYWLIASLFLIGMFIPTSVNGNLWLIPIAAAQMLTLAVFLFLIVYLREFKVVFLILGIIISLIVWSATMLNTEVHGVRSLEANTFILICLMLLINFKKIKAHQSIKTIFLITNIAMVLIGFGMVTSNAMVKDFFIRFYSDFYAELVPWMLLLEKPILTFGTHSLAGFYLFVFCYLNIRTFVATGSKLNLLFSVIFLYFCFNLESNAGYAFMILGLIVLFLNIKRKISAIAVLLLLGLVFAAYQPIQTQQAINTVQEALSETFTKSTNGVIGRYSDSGNQTKNLEYIKENPLSPTGLARKFDGLTYYDSGFIANTLIGTIALPVVLYGALFLFLKENISRKKSALLLFLAFLFMELGYNNLFYFRTLCIVPFMIIYLNYIYQVELNREPVAEKKPKSKIFKRVVWKTTTA